MGTETRGRYYGGRRPSSDDSLHSPTVIPPSALDKPSIMKRYHRRRTCSHTSSRRSPTMVTLHDTGFVECRWWNDGWTVKTVVTWRSSASMIPAPAVEVNHTLTICYKVRCHWIHACRVRRVENLSGKSSRALLITKTHASLRVSSNERIVNYFPGCYNHRLARQQVHGAKNVKTRKQRQGGDAWCNG